MPRPAPVLVTFEKIASVGGVPCLSALGGDGGNLLLAVGRDVVEVFLYEVVVLAIAAVEVVLLPVSRSVERVGARAPVQVVLAAAAPRPVGWPPCALALLG